MSAAAIVITCHNLGRTLEEALDSALAQRRTAAEIVIVDDGSTDLYTQQVLARISRPTVTIRCTEHCGVAAARATGIALTSAPYIVLLDADDVLHHAYLERTAAVLDTEPAVAFVTCATRDYDDETNVWTPPPFTLIDQLTQNGAHVSTLFRREVWTELESFDDRLTCFEDVDFWTRAVAHGFHGSVVNEPLLRYRRRRASRSRGALVPARYVTTMDIVTGKHEAVLSHEWLAFLLAKERFLLDQRSHTATLHERRDALTAELDRCRDEANRLHDALARSGSAPIDLPDLRSREPISDCWGMDRGLPIDRVYIEAFLERHRANVTGAVLEVKDTGYTERFGQGVISRDVLDVDPQNPLATLRADLADSDAFPEGRFDCFICTQTLTCIYDVKAAVRTVYKVLKPGGVFLCTVSSVNRLSPEDGGPDGDYWRFTEASLRAALAEVFPLDRVDVTSHGNVLACASLLYGLAASDVGGGLGPDDPYFPLVICARACKPAEPAPEHHGRADVRRRVPSARLRKRAGGPGLILMYHRVLDVEHDPVGIAIPRDLFQRQLEVVRALADVVPLTYFASRFWEPTGKPPVALTFDDGTIDHLEVSASLSEEGIPATYFVTSDRLDEPHEHYWDRLEWLLRPAYRLPATIDLSLEGIRRTIPTSRAGDRLDAVRAIGASLAKLGDAEREQVMAYMKLWAGDAAEPRASHRVLLAHELIALGARSKQTVGSHTRHHLMLPLHSLDVQITEVTESRVALERLLQRPVGIFGYPFGAESASTREIVCSAGFNVAVGVERRPCYGADNPYALPRVDARDHSPDSLAALLKLLQRSDGNTPVD